MIHVMSKLIDSIDIWALFVKYYIYVAVINNKKIHIVCLLRCLLTTNINTLDIILTQW